ncbi:WEE2 [Symbiodinium sp. CCMP2592]|nr:WEE2 [Symbiodinium sp. CCMP2592]
MEAAACPYIVRYYSSWVEDSRLHIQTELCQCSLRDKLSEHQQDCADPRFQEGELIEVLQHVASGLKKLHGLSIVHLDIKPDNILLSRGEPGYFKIADLGLAAAAIGARCDDITEGDCRYLAKEVLQGDFADLPKADVFSLGLVLYELGTNPNCLPSNGPGWHSLRRSLEVALLPELSPKLLQLMQDLVQPRKELRPTCEAVLQKLQEDAAFSHPDPVQVQALQDEARRCREEAMRNRQRADEYWQEILCLKKQELMYGKSGAALGDGARVQLRRSKTSC